MRQSNKRGYLFRISHGFREQTNLKHRLHVQKFAAVCLRFHQRETPLESTGWCVRFSEETVRKLYEKRYGWFIEGNFEWRFSIRSIGQVLTTLNYNSCWMKFERKQRISCNNLLIKPSYYRRYLNVGADKNEIKIRASVRDEWSVDKIFIFLSRYSNNNTQ